MSKLDVILDNSYMVLSQLAFVFRKGNYIDVYNVKDIKQITTFRIRDAESILLCESNMSEANKYKSMAIIERNKKFLIGGYSQWVNTQRNV